MLGCGTWGMDDGVDKQARNRMTYESKEFSMLFFLNWGIIDLTLY